MSEYNRSHMEMVMQDSAALGATAFRWNAFLKGLDFEWEPMAIPQDGSKTFDQRHLVQGLCAGCLEALKDAADLAAKHGLLLQVVLSTGKPQHPVESDSRERELPSVRCGLPLSLTQQLHRDALSCVLACGLLRHLDAFPSSSMQTLTSHIVHVLALSAHFFRWGYGGPDFELRGIKNRQRVVNLHHMLTDDGAMRAYLSRVRSRRSPSLSAICLHLALCPRTPRRWSSPWSTRWVHTRPFSASCS